MEVYIALDKLGQNFLKFDIDVKLNKNGESLSLFLLLSAQ